MDYNKHLSRIEMKNLLHYLSSSNNIPTCYSNTNINTPLKFSFHYNKTYKSKGNLNSYNINTPKNFSTSKNNMANTTTHHKYPLFPSHLLVINKKGPKIINNCLPLFPDKLQKISFIKSKYSYVNYTTKPTSLEQILNLKQKFESNPRPYKIKSDSQAMGKIYLKTNNTTEFSGEGDLKKWNSNLQLSKQNDVLYLTSSKKNSTEYTVSGETKGMIMGELEKMGSIGKHNLLKSEEKNKSLSQFSQMQISQIFLEDQKNQENNEIHEIVRDKEENKENNEENDKSRKNNESEKKSIRTTSNLEIINNGNYTMNNIFPKSNSRDIILCNANFESVKNIKKNISNTSISNTNIINNNNSNTNSINNQKQEDRPIRKTRKKYEYHPSNSKEKFNLIKTQANKMLDSIQSNSHPINLKELHNRIDSLKKIKNYLYKEGLGKDNNHSLKSNNDNSSDSSDTNLGFKAIKPKIKKGYFYEEFLSDNDEMQNNYKYNRLTKPVLIKQTTKPRLNVLSYSSLKDLDIN